MQILPEKQNLILAIDTSCDETSVAVLLGNTVLSNFQPSQIDLHKQYGGVVPSIAKLAHQERIDSVVIEALKRSGKTIEEIDSIAVTKGPGLAIALEVGIKKAKELAEKYSKPLVNVNHMEGHLLSAFAERNSKLPHPPQAVPPLLKERAVIPQFPAIGVLVSGGHTEFILVEDFGKYKKIGETVDDACGECFDKCGRFLGLGYPAGPTISKFAKENRKNIKLEIINKNQSVIVKGVNIHSQKEYNLPIPMQHSGDLNFSYSGLKTAFRDFISKFGESNLNSETIKDLCVVFEHAALMQVVLKLEKAVKIYNPKEIWLGGGVVASTQLRSLIRKSLNKNIKLRFPYSNKLTGDNAAMIGIVANIITNDELRMKNNKEVYLDPKEFGEIDREPNLSF
ncbi:MAG: tRNA (adenosine(37)-N6)-threonylcarbamoyltransferase complex transferase subunit TsaD [Candidatus Dojkabacteria bacterium]